jgi:hypothetical protein
MENIPILIKINVLEKIIIRISWRFSFSFDIILNTILCRVIKRFGWPKSVKINVKLYIDWLTFFKNIRPV